MASTRNSSGAQYVYVYVCSACDYSGTRFEVPEKCASCGSDDICTTGTPLNSLPAEARQHVHLIVEDPPDPPIIN